MVQIQFRTASTADWPAIQALLTQASLPLDGAKAHLPHFLLAVQGDSVIATAGLERYGPVVLLRSVAVRDSERGTGLGREIVRRVLTHAANDGVKGVYLLTTTAEHFFLRFGFERVSRTEVPDKVLASPEFQSACPASAIVMGLGLVPPQEA